jgi:hypothetical protein
MAAVPDNGRMIAAMLRGDRQAWFFKAVAPPEQMDAAVESILGFLRSVTFDQAEGRPTWQTPADWEELPASGMRLATLKVPVGDESVELSVIGLGLIDDWDAQVLDNVNRWRGQLGMAPVKAEAIVELETIDVAGRPLVIADLHGGDSPSKKADVATDGPPAEKKPLEEPASEESAAKNPSTEGAKGPLSYKLPKDWVELPTNTMRLANLTVGDGETEAAVTGFAFSASAPAMADPLANINRWRGEIGMPPITQDELDKDVEKMDIDGMQSTYVDLMPEGNEEFTLAAMGQRDDKVWFFKLRGPAETVAAQREAFKAWLASLRFKE